MSYNQTKCLQRKHNNAKAKYCTIEYILKTKIYIYFLFKRNKVDRMKRYEKKKHYYVFSCLSCFFVF